jgi:hypothetical protein
VDPVPDPLLLRKSGSAGNRKYLFNTKCKWENKVKRGNNPHNGSWKPKYRMRNWTDKESRNFEGTVMVVLVTLAIATDLT